MSKTMSDEFTAWIDRLDERNELTVEQLILMNEAWEAGSEHWRSRLIDATKMNAQGKS